MQTIVFRPSAHRLFRAALILGTVVMGVSPANAQFTRIVRISDLSNPLTNLSAPALNNNGAVAFAGSVNGDGRVYRADAGGGVIQFNPLSRTGINFARVAVNDSGAVVFAGFGFGPIVDFPAIYSATNASDTVQRYGGGEGLGSVNINNSNTIGFSFSSRAGQGSVSATITVDAAGNQSTRGSGSINVPQTGSPSGDYVGGAALNNQGDVAYFRGGLNFPPSQIERVLANGTKTVFSGNGFLAQTAPSINDAGRVLFATAANTLLLSDAASNIITIASSTSGFTNFVDYSLNDLNDAAFVATQGGVQGLYLAASGASSPVRLLGVGDSLFNGIVTELELHRDGLNNSKTVAFRYRLSNNEVGIGTFSASAAPEPGTILLIAVVGLPALGLVLRRRN